MTDKGGSYTCKWVQEQPPRYDINNRQTRFKDQWWGLQQMLVVRTNCTQKGAQMIEATNEDREVRSQVDYRKRRQIGLRRRKEIDPIRGEDKQSDDRKSVDSAGRWTVLSCIWLVANFPRTFRAVNSLLLFRQKTHRHNECILREYIRCYTISWSLSIATSVTTRTTTNVRSKSLFFHSFGVAFLKRSCIREWWARWTWKYKIR